MMRTVAILVVCGIVSSLWSVEASSPVVLWTLKRIGDGRVESNLNEFSSIQFADLVAWKSEHGNIPIMAFGLNSLSLEDLTPQGAAGASEPFRKLRRITDASAETLLFPAVQSASDSISILQSKGFDVIQINAGEPLPKIENPSTILVVLDKASVNMDDEILRVFSKYTLDFPNLVGMLWGKQSTWSEEPEEEVNEVLTRKKRQAPTPDEPYVYNDEKGLFMVFREVKLTMIQGLQTNNVSFTKADSCDTATSVADVVILTCKFTHLTGGIKINQFDLKLNLTKGKLGYWKMSDATVILKGSDFKAFDFPETRLASAVDLTVPGDRSFHCSRFGSLYPRGKQSETQNQTQTFTIDIKGFQIQAFMGPAVSKQNIFVDEYECVGFFTPGIWMGIVVTIVLLSILSWGMKMLMDVKTMDRFDDPKGKPISFGSGE